MKTNVLAIVNPKAGTIRDKSVLLEDIVLIFDSQTFGFDRLEVVESEGPGHATELARKAAMEGFGLCLAFGGDGTMNEVAKGLLHSETALGIIPLGSGNGLARHLKISMKPKEAFKQMLTGKTLQMDHGLANRNPFFLAAGLGFEGVVAH
ncbi:MAG TPA: acylglycerol kinase family protein, partial [Catalimonadaceae bacterium]|nr:acylglycerol kinase family protein [Catalimonadaceae bacterium]